MAIVTVKEDDRETSWSGAELQKILPKMLDIALSQARQKSYLTLHSVKRVIKKNIFDYFDGKILEKR